jgi:hypothetical protein
MGQYYKIVNTETMEWICPNGIKLMEHSWVGNGTMGQIMQLLVEGGKWFKSKIVWCGDYYDEDGETPYYSMVKDSDEIRPLDVMPKEEQKKAFLVNHTKKQYVDYSKLPHGDGQWESWTINPLSLLAALGNGRGGGDYHDQYPDFDKVGSWAGDELSIAFTAPKDSTELAVNFIESN